MARCRINLGVAGKCFLDGFFSFVRSLWVRRRMNVRRLLGRCAGGDLCHNAEGVLVCDLHPYFALARLESPISKGGTETTRTYRRSSREKDESKLWSLSIWRT
jgi:hypothetical protein